MAAPPSFRRGEIIARRYQVVNKSGETALWVGYYATDQGATSHPNIEQRGSIPEPDVLVKVVKPDLCPEPAMREKLVRDLQRMRGLQHPGMPRLMDVQHLEEHNTVVLSEAIQAGLSQGVLLRRMVSFRQKERFPLAEVRQIGAQLAHALSYIHGQSYLHGAMLCHGDLRLESVLLRPDGAKLCDIGLGAALPRAIYLEAVKKVNEVELLSPEVRAGRPPDPRSDVFGLAALYRHLLSVGQGGGWEALLAEKPAMGLVLTRAMHEDPAQRYASIEALIADIEAVALTGAPIRRRLAPTPLAMAVAAGRLPVEELNRPVEELMPESARSRRNSGIFEVGAVLAPLSGAPSAKMSIGTIPPQLGGPNSARSGRLPEGPSTDSNPSGLSRDGSVQQVAKGATSATSKGPTSGVSRGGARADTPSGLSLPAAGDASVAQNGSARSKDGEAAALTPEGVPQATAAAPPPEENTGTIDDTAPYRRQRPLRETAAPVSLVPQSLISTQPPNPPHASAPVTEIGGDEGRSGRRTLPDASEIGRLDKSLKSPPSDPLRADTRVPSSSRSHNASQRSQRTRSGESISRNSTASLSLPPNALITSRLALVGALALAALVGALVAVVVMLLLRPASLLAPIPPPQPAVPDKPPPPPVEPVPMTPVPVVPIGGDPSPAPAAAAGSAASAPGARPTPPLRLASEPQALSEPPAPTPTPTPAPTPAAAPPAGSEAPVAAAPPAAPTPPTAGPKAGKTKGGPRGTLHKPVKPAGVRKP